MIRHRPGRPARIAPLVSIPIVLLALLPAILPGILLAIPLLGSVLLAPACAPSPEPLLTATTLEEALGLARSHEALVLVEFWRDG